jgi:hypothetical protein
MGGGLEMRLKKLTFVMRLEEVDFVPPEADLRMQLKKSTLVLRAKYECNWKAKKEKPFWKQKNE